MTLWPSPTRRASTAHLIGLVPCLGLTASSSGGHDMTHDLNMLGHGSFKKVRPRPRPGPNFRYSINSSGIVGVGPNHGTQKPSWTLGGPICFCFANLAVPNQVEHAEAKATVLWSPRRARIDLPPNKCTGPALDWIPTCRVRV
jgi:hypothetical protein